MSYLLKALARIDELTVSSKSSALLIGLVGPPGSGKSVLSESILRNYGRDTCVVIPMDGFHLYKHELEAFENKEEMKRRRGAPFTFNVEKFVSLLLKVKNRKEGEEIKAPSFDHAKGDPVENDITIKPSHSIIIVEGLYLLFDEGKWKEIKTILDYTFFLGLPIDLALQRCALRNSKAFNISLDEANERVKINDKLNGELVVKSCIYANEILKEESVLDNKSWAPSSPSNVVVDGISDVLTTDQIKSWTEKGFALVDNVFPMSLLNDVKNEVMKVFPAPGTDEAAKFTDFGGSTLLTFPTKSFPSVNQIPIHPNCLKVVSQLLKVKVEDIRLTQAEVWPKYGRSGADNEFDNSDQRMHCDYPNHTLTHPPTWYEPEAVEMILYLNDVSECGGATAVVPREGDNDVAYTYPIMNMPGVQDLEWKNNKDIVEDFLRKVAPEKAKFRKQHLYPREQHAQFKFGSLLLYRHDTWHRGTPLIHDTLRVVINMTFKKAQSDWISVLHSGWSWSMYRQGMVSEKLIAKATVDQRCVLGFPSPSSKYWNEQTIIAVGSRYSCLGMDMTPYIEGMKNARK